MKTDLKRLYPEELEAFMKTLGEPKFRALQVFSWIHKKKAASFQEMTNLSLELRKKLEEQAEIPALKAVKILKSAVDGSEKYLFELPDGNLIETMLMRYHYGISVCVSTQVGCRMGCAFCASTIGGLTRSLSASEILSEIYEIERITGETVGHVVLMGGGEPFDNYGEVVRFLRLINHPDGKNLSLRNVTLRRAGCRTGSSRSRTKGFR